MLAKEGRKKYGDPSSFLGIDGLLHLRGRAWCLILRLFVHWLI